MCKLSYVHIKTKYHLHYKTGNKKRKRWKT